MTPASAGRFRNAPRGSPSSSTCTVFDFAVGAVSLFGVQRPRPATPGRWQRRYGERPVLMGTFVEGTVWGAPVTGRPMGLQWGTRREAAKPIVIISTETDQNSLGLPFDHDFRAVLMAPLTTTQCLAKTGFAEYVQETRSRSCRSVSRGPGTAENKGTDVVRRDLSARCGNLGSLLCVIWLREGECHDE